MSFLCDKIYPMGHKNIHTYWFVLLLNFFLINFNASGFQSTSGASGYALLPSVSCIERGEILFSTWGSYITSVEFKGTGIFPLSFATGISKRSEGFFTFSGVSGFSDFDNGITAGFKLNIYNSNNIYPSAGVLIESYSMETSPDARISFLLEKPLPWNFTLHLSAGYSAGKSDRSGATGGAGFVYGKGFPKIIFGAKSLNNGNINTVFLSGIFRIIDRLFVNIISGHTFSDLNTNFIAAGFTYAMFKEKVITPVETAPPEIIKPPEEKRFPATVPKFRLKMR